MRLSLGVSWDCGTFGAKTGPVPGEPGGLVAVVVQVTTWPASICQRRPGPEPGPDQETVLEANESQAITTTGFLDYTFWELLQRVLSSGWVQEPSTNVPDTAALKCPLYQPGVAQPSTVILRRKRCCEGFPQSYPKGSSAVGTGSQVGQPPELP